MKRLFDISLIFLSLPILVPAMVGIYLLVLIFIGYPGFFIQERPGINCKPFRMFKFRTMNNKTDSSGKLLSDNSRLTGFGSFLRKTSLDELPELINVIKGEMSLVGPRPLLMKYIERYDDEQIKRHNVLPGITGWAQINGRNSLSWKEKFELDLWYVKNCNFLLDIKILFLTIIKVLTMKNVNNSKENTMDEFMGNK